MQQLVEKYVNTHMPVEKYFTCTIPGNHVISYLLNRLKGFLESLKKPIVPSVTLYYLVQ